jgi:hypothetical protein
MGETEVSKNDILIKLSCDAKPNHVMGDTERPKTKKFWLNFSVIRGEILKGRNQGSNERPK